MATIQLGRTQSANRLISYAEKRAEVREGVDCPSEYAKSQMNATRQIWGKTEGIQAHHVIQSFKPGEVTPEMANEIGRDLAKEIAKGHECVVYTHTDKEHIHNHIVINSVNYENGSKYQAHGKEAIERVRETSDRLCMERDLSVVKEKSAEVRYTQAEKSLVEQGKHSWKDEIRDKIDHEKKASKSYEEFKGNLLEKHGIEVRERGKNTTYINHENGKRVRGNKLGEAYEKETIKHEFEKFKAREGERGQERGNSDLPNQQSRGSAEGVSRIAEHHPTSDEGRTRTPGQNDTSRGLSVNASEGERAEGNRNNGRTGANQPSQPAPSQASDFNLDEFNKRLEARKRGLKEGHRKQYQHYQSVDKTTGERIGQEQGNHREQAEPNRAEQQEQRERAVSKDIELGPER